MHQKDFRTIQAMLEKAQRVTTFSQNSTRRDLDEDRMLRDAIQVNLVWLGYAAQAVSRATKNQFPEIAWSGLEMRGIRLIERYWDVDLDDVWSLVQTDLPLLMPALEAILEAEYGTKN